MRPIRVTVARTRGSVPREAGASMLVWPDRTEGTIGGGALEWAAMAEARRMLEDGIENAEKTLPLGPALGQCCGGAVTLRFDREAAERPEGTPVWLWGAGHVGRAIAAVIDPLPQVALTWVDTSADRFPAAGPGGPGGRVVAAEPARLVPHAPRAAHHLILTYSHEIDLALCHALLCHGSASCGLIGSATKWARFRARLRALGHSDATISGIRCPIGQPELGKHPQAIAIGVAAQLVLTLETTQTLDDTGT